MQVFRTQRVITRLLAIPRGEWVKQSAKFFEKNIHLSAKNKQIWQFNTKLGKQNVKRRFLGF